jgi:hypothetical protein
VGKRPSLTGVPSGSWGYNADDELSGETYDQDGNVTAAGANQFSVPFRQGCVAGCAAGAEANARGVYCGGVPVRGGD